MMNKEELKDPTFREKLADTVYQIYGGSWGNALGLADQLLKVVVSRDASRDQQIALAARIDEASYWKSAIEYPIMDNAHRLPERMEKRITNLEAEIATLKQAQEKHS